MGSHDKIKWIWTTITNSNNYVRSDGLFKIKISADGLDDVILDEISIRYRYPAEDLDCVDSGFVWEVSPLGTASGNIRIRNIGDSGTELDWKIVDWPEWGEKWFFNPEEGYDLKPEDGFFKILLTVQAPVEYGEYFGVVRIENSYDSSDYEVVKIDLTTPRNRLLEINPLLQMFIKRFPSIFPILHLIFQKF
jgi:hypothetical protein